MSWNMENSTRLGSIRMYFSSSGVAWKSMPAISALMQTLFPDPVAPAISRCGMRVRSPTTVLPETSVPIASDKSVLSFWKVGVGLHPDPLDLIFHEGRPGLVAGRDDGQYGLSDGGLFPARCGHHLVLDRLLQCGNRRLELGGRGRWRSVRPIGRGHTVDGDQHRFGGFGTHHLVARIPGFRRLLFSDGPFGLWPIRKGMLA